MKRVGKHEGIGNVIVEDAPIPEIGPRDILVRTVRSLISRGSEIGRRYLYHEQIDPAIMGYSVAGVVAAVGNDVTEYQIGQRVGISAPHAEYVRAMSIGTRAVGSFRFPTRFRTTRRLFIRWRPVV